MIFPNSVYKFFSSMVVRLIDCLPKIINEDQTGFISCCFIGESTEMVHNTIVPCRIENIEVNIIRFLQNLRHSTIEWYIIADVLRMSNFGDNFSKILKLFQETSTSKVEENNQITFNHHLDVDKVIPSPCMFVYFVERSYLMQ